jgi:putative methyltransferase (TIGR04325 family)
LQGRLAAFAARVTETGEQYEMNRWKLKLVQKLPWSLVSRSPRFGHVNTWFGLYPSWAAALAAIPAGNLVGYDQTAAKEMFTSYPTTLVRQSDYAYLLHLRNAIKPGMRVIDVGGSIGQAYYIAQKFISLPDPFEWSIFDVPAVLDAARDVAVREGEKGKYLRFVSSPREAGNCDAFFSSGSLQLIEDTLPELLQQLPSLPQHVLINRIPVWTRPAVITLNDMGFSIAPYNVFNHDAWVQSVERLGYRLVDEWKCPESNFFSIRFRRGSKLDAYSGFYFERTS